MAAPKGNQFWKNRSKHGREKLFANAELLWIAATEYFEWCDNNPWIKQENKTTLTGVESKETPTERPYTLSGFALYCDASTSWWREFRKNAEKDFLSVITRIEEIIYTQKFEGAAVGAFNANIIARDLGLKDEKDLTTNGKEINNTSIIVKDKETKAELDKLINGSD